MASLTVSLSYHTIRPRSSQQGLTMDYNARRLSPGYFFAFDCMGAYSAMHDRVPFCVAPARYSYSRTVQLSSYKSIGVQGHSTGAVLSVPL